MATITVKELSGLQRALKIEIARRIFFANFLPYWLRRAPSSGVLTTLLAACVLLGLATLCSVRAQNVSARISLLSTVPARVRIDARFPDATSALSFRNSYAGVLGLGERIEAIEGFAAGGEPVQIQKLAPGEFRASQKLSRFRYEVNLAPPKRPAQMSHVSWLNADQGLLMMADLLPERTDSNISSVVINIHVPNGWAVTSNVKLDSQQQFSTADPQTAVFLVGRVLTEKRHRLGATTLSVVTSGKWPVSNSDLIKTSTQILQHYSRITGFTLRPG